MNGKEIWNEVLEKQEKLEVEITKLKEMLEPIAKDANLTRRRQVRYRDEVHRHIDALYRDIMIVLEKQLHFVGEHGLVLKTNAPVAINSRDHLYPTGTAQDNTRYPRFIKKCEEIFGENEGLAFMDLGCSGGGMVLDAILRGHLGIGLEGSDYSLIRQRAEWRLLRKNLFTCDITKPFAVEEAETGEIKKFDVVTAWEVLEHISEDDLPQLFENIKVHLKANGIFVASVACKDSIPSKYGVNMHVTIHSKDWWMDVFKQNNFEHECGKFSLEDMARGGINFPLVYREELVPPENKEEGFFVVLKKKQ